MLQLFVLKEDPASPKTLKNHGSVEINFRDFLAKDEELNTHLSARLKSLMGGEFRQLKIKKILFKIDSFSFNGIRYIPGAMTLSIDYEVYQVNQQLPPPTWKIERFLYEKNLLFPEGSPQCGRGGVKKSWQNWQELLSCAKSPESCVFSNYQSISGYPEIFLAVALCSSSEETKQIPHNCYRCRYFYGEEHDNNFVVCGFYPKGKQNCQNFKLSSARRIAV